MSGFAQWLADRRHRRVILIAVLFPLPLLSILSGAIVVMSAARDGWRGASQDCGLALLVLLATSLLTGGAWQAVTFAALINWSAMTVIGSLVGTVPAFGLPMQVITLLVVSLAAIFSIWVGDTQAYWRPVLERLATDLGDMGWVVPPPEGLDELAARLTGFAAASVLVTLTLTLLLGMALYCRLINVSLAALFREIRLGYVVGILAAICGLLALFPSFYLAQNLMLVFSAAFLFQGLSVIHWAAHVRGWPRFWPIAVYAPFFLGPVVAAGVVFALSATGFVDNWFNLRRSRSNVV
jgi:hypothetical protein